jgi:hypothetical protein
MISAFNLVPTMGLLLFVQAASNLRFYNEPGTVRLHMDAYGTVWNRMAGF